jgi:hypothetical protein
MYTCDVCQQTFVLLSHSKPLHWVSGTCRRKPANSCARSKHGCRGNLARVDRQYRFCSILCLGAPGRLLLLQLLCVGAVQSPAPFVSVPGSLAAPHGKAFLSSRGAVAHGASRDTVCQEERARLDSGREEIKGRETGILKNPVKLVDKISSRSQGQRTACYDPGPGPSQRTTTFQASDATGSCWSSTRWRPATQ